MNCVEPPNEFRCMRCRLTCRYPYFVNQEDDPCADSRGHEWAILIDNRSAAEKESDERR